MRIATWVGGFVGTRNRATGLMAACFLALISSTATADILLPDAFGGVWSIESVTTDCATGDTVDVSTEPATLFCPGQSMEELFALGGLVSDMICTGSVTSTSVNATCTGTFSPLPDSDCICTLTVIYTGSVVGDEITLTAQTTLTYAGDCLTLPDSCTNSESTGTLVTRDVTAQCVTSVQPQGWGSIKAAYR